MSFGTNASARVPLDDRMPRVAIATSSSPSCDRGCGSSCTAAVSASAAEHVDRCEAAAVSWIRGASATTRGAQRVEEFDLALDDRSSAPSDLFWCSLSAGVVSARRRRSSACDGSPRHVGEVRFRGSRCSTEDAVVADLRESDARCAPVRLPPSPRCAASPTADAAQIVEFRIDAVAHDAAVARDERGLVQ